VTGKLSPPQKGNKKEAVQAPFFSNSAGYLEQAKI